MLAHRTQLSLTDSPIMAMGPDLAAEIFGEESFALRVARDGGTATTDLFEGL